MPRRQRRVLVIEDTKDLAFGLRINLEGDGFYVIVAERIREAKVALVQKPALIVHDLMLPDCNDLNFLKEIRARGFALPVIILSAKGEEIDPITGLKLGADDYVSKPFSVGEFLERVKARFRTADRRPAIYESGNTKLDFV